MFGWTRRRKREAESDRAAAAVSPSATASIAASKESLAPFDLPLIEAGAPLPVLLTDETATVFVYRIAPADPAFDRMGPDEARLGEPWAVVTAESCLAVTFGGPNDEALPGHRLHPLGLQYYASMEVLNSAWIAEMEMRNRVHRSHHAGLFAGHRHFILTFHDSTMEIVCRSLSGVVWRGEQLDLLLEAHAKARSGE
jgi:hypothetical protein